MDEVMIIIGNRIRKRRKELGLTQTEIFEKCGIASGALSKIENGIRTPSVIIFYKIAQILECDMEWLITGNCSNSHITNFCQKEEKILHNFQLLSEKDQEDIEEFIEFKLYKREKDKLKITK